MFWKLFQCQESIIQLQVNRYGPRDIHNTLSLLKQEKLLKEQVDTASIYGSDEMRSLVY